MNLSQTLLCLLQRILGWSVLLILAFVGVSAQAATYTLSASGTLPPNCSRASSTSYSCTNLTLGWQDSIIVANANTRLTVTGTASFNTNQINWNSPASGFVLMASAVSGTFSLNGNLVITGSGTTAMATSTNIQGALTSNGAVKTGWTNTITGPVSATSFTSGGGSTYGAGITATSGAVSLEGSDTVTGDVSAVTTVALAGNVSGRVTAGDAITAAWATHVTGAISGTSFSSGGGSTYGGGITASTGAVTLAGSDAVTGAVVAATDAALAGSISGTVTAGGAVTTAWGTRVTSSVSGKSFSGGGAGSFGSIVASNGSVSLGVLDAVSGNVTASGSVTLASAASVSGSVFSGGNVLLAAALTHVERDVTASGSVELQAGTWVNGNVSSSTSVTLDTVSTVAHCVSAPAGSNTISLQFGTSAGGVCCVSSNSSSCDDSCVSRGWAVAMPATCSSSSPVANFSCVESGADAATGHLNTKLAGTQFSVDVVALGINGQQNTTFASGGNRQVNVELVDGKGSTACSARNTVVSSQSVTFASSHKGRRSINLIVPTANSDLRCRVTDTAVAVTGCSGDDFAVRPTSFAVTTSDAGADATGTSTNATPVIKAGAVFSLTATANVTGYDGVPSVDTTQVVPHTGGIAGAVTASFSRASALTSQATATTVYSEVGYFKLNIGGVRDTTFTAVDSANGDCTSDFSNSLTSGKYGCYFGNAVATNYFGRFIPDHFALSAGSSLVNRSDISTASSSTFTYLGEPFKAAFTLIAQNAMGDTTQNYEGSFAKLNSTAVSSFGLAAVNDPVVALPALTSTCVSCGSWVKGFASESIKLTFARDADNKGPFEALKIGIAPKDSDNVTLASLALDIDTDATAGNDHKSIGSTIQRFGVLRLGNAYGSEILPLRVPVEVQYWNGTVFQTNYADSHTLLSTSNFVFGTFVHKDAHAVGTASITSLSSTITNGRASLILAPPGRGSAGSVDLCVDLGPDNHGASFACAGSSASRSYLQGAWGGTSYDYDPQARATFGIYKRNNEMIYLRENY